MDAQALKLLRTAEYAPYVVFIAAPTAAFSNKVSGRGQYHADWIDSRDR